MASKLSRTVKSDLVEELRDAIICGEFAPGQRLLLEDIAIRFDISITPVREALRDLESEGLVAIFPHRGAVVTELSSDDLLDIYDVRATLEEMATRLAVPVITEDTLTQLESYVEQMDNHLDNVATLVKLNHNFHYTLYCTSGRRHLCELTTMLRYRTQHYLHAYIELSGMPMAQEEHRAIIEACRNSDAERAATIIREHVTHVGNSIIEHVRQKEREKESTD